MDRPPKFHHQAKVICLGNSGVGKSSLALRFCDDEWSPSFISTIGVDFKYRIVDIDGMRIRLLLWDTAGQERYRTITQAFYRGSEGVLLVYDISDYSSFEGIRTWVDSLNEAGVGNSQYIPKLLVGNKTDATNRAVSAEQGRKLAEEIGAMFCETSAKYSDGVTAGFMMLARDIKTKRLDEDPNFRFRAQGNSGEARPDFKGAKGSRTIIPDTGSKPRSSVSGICCAS